MQEDVVMLTRRLGRSGIQISAMGLGCWAIGGPLWYMDGNNRRPLSWGDVKDNRSIQAIRHALELGVNFFDTADAYGCGHSEQVLGQALEGHRDDVVVATKFGSIFDEETKTWLGHDHPDGIITPEFVRKACDASLKRLNTDYIDLYQFHWKEYDVNLAGDLIPVLEELVAEGKIRYYGWSTPYEGQARVFVEGPHCTAIQCNYNIIERNPEILALCNEFDQATIARGPFAMGILTGKYNTNSKIPKDDMRHFWWDLQKGREAQQLEMLGAIHEILTRDGRTISQAALGWLWALDPMVIPIPGFKTMRQVEENIEALRYGKLSSKQIHEIEKVLETYSYDLTKKD